MPTYYRGFCTKSGSIFDEKKGFVAKSQDKIFSLDTPGTSREYLEEHLVWGNHGIPSPLISASNEERAVAKACSSQQFWKDVDVDCFVAVIWYPSQPPNAYKMVDTASRLGVTPQYRDRDECLFAKEIPLENVMAVWKYSASRFHFKFSQLTSCTGFNSWNVLDGYTKERIWQPSPESLSLFYCKCSAQDLENRIECLRNSICYDGCFPTEGNPEDQLVQHIDAISWLLVEDKTIESSLALLVHQARTEMAAHHLERLADLLTIHLASAKKLRERGKASPFCSLVNRYSHHVYT